jgi:hypothetical protein
MAQENVLFKLKVRHCRRIRLLRLDLSTCSIRVVFRGINTTTLPCAGFCCYLCDARFLSFVFWNSVGKVFSEVNVEFFPLVFCLNADLGTLH